MYKIINTLIDINTVILLR